MKFCLKIVKTVLFHEFRRVVLSTPKTLKLLQKILCPIVCNLGKELKDNIVNQPIYLKLPRCLFDK